MPTFNKSFFNKTSLDPQTKQPKVALDPLKIGLLGLAAIVLVFVLAGSVRLITKALEKPPVRQIPQTDSERAIDLEKKRAEEASRAAEAAQTPQAQLTTAYKDIVGSTDFLRSISFEGGLGTISYTINSSDNNIVLTTGYQNFADFASRVFNIPELKRFRTVVYTTALVDSQGQAKEAAMTLEISREKAEKVNWQINKFRYETFPANLDVNKIHPSFEKEYEALVKKD